MLGRFINQLLHMEQKYNYTSHRVYSMKAHIILVTKYRKSILQNDIEVSMKEIMKEISRYWKFEIEAIECDLDHMHILISYNFRDRIDKIIDSIKMNSTKSIWKTYASELSKVYYRERTFWSDGAFVCSTGGVGTDIIINYINNQKTK